MENLRVLPASLRPALAAPSDPFSPHHQACLSHRPFQTGPYYQLPLLSNCLPVFVTVLFVWHVHVSPLLPWQVSQDPTWVQVACTSSHRPPPPCRGPRTARPHLVWLRVERAPHVLQAVHGRCRCRRERGIGEAVCEGWNRRWTQRARPRCSRETWRARDTRYLHLFAQRDLSSQGDFGR